MDFLPIDLSLDVKTVRYDTLKVAKRLEAELGEEQASFIEGTPSDWELLPPPEGSFKVGIDGGYVRNWADKKHKFEVIVGKSIRRFMDGTFCAFAGLYSLNYPRFVSQTYQLCKTETLICETSL